MFEELDMVEQSSLVRSGATSYECSTIVTV